MRLLRRIILIFLPAVALTGGLIAAVILPGPQHLLCPVCHGLDRLADNVYIDPVTPPAERRRISAGLARARRRVARFFGRLEATPTIVICQTRQCAAMFGTHDAKGIAFAWHAILLTKTRLFSVIAAHEYAHTELHWRMGLRGWLLGTVPAWFNEGLATLISEDPRFQHDWPRQDVRAMMSVRSYLGDWARYTERVGWRTAYGAARTRVRQLERRIGRAGLRRFVDRLIRDGDLTGLMRRAERGEKI